MRGRKPKPTALHKLTGTFNTTKHLRDRPHEPVAVGDLTGAPAWLSDDQRAGWEYAMRHAPAGLLKSIDQGVLTVWVVAEDQHRVAVIAQTKIDIGSALPLLTKDKNGMPAASPYLGIINRTAARMLKAGSELGFSPAARPRLNAGAQVDTNAPTSPWSEFEVIEGGKKTG